LVEIKYSGYLERQQRVIDGFRRLEERQIPPETDYTSIAHLRREAAERWSAVRPRSVGQAARVSGIHPTDLSLLLVYLARPDREPVTPTGKRGVKLPAHDLPATET
jgi:tRNA uridine 5-carboxymethylaminomethyl modification enzyme